MSRAFKKHIRVAKFVILYLSQGIEFFLYNKSKLNKLKGQKYRFCKPLAARSIPVSRNGEEDILRMSKPILPIHHFVLRNKIDLDANR